MNTHRTRDPLVSFLCILLRDHLTAGEVEGIMLSHIEDRPKTSVLSNGFVAEHAEDIAARLRVGKRKKARR